MVVILRAVLEGTCSRLLICLLSCHTIYTVFKTLWNPESTYIFLLACEYVAKRTDSCIERWWQGVGVGEVEPTTKESDKRYSHHQSMLTRLVLSCCTFAASVWMYAHIFSECGCRCCSSWHLSSCSLEKRSLHVLQTYGIALWRSRRHVDVCWGHFSICIFSVTRPCNSMPSLPIQ